MDGAQARAEQSKAANAGEDSPAVGSDGVEIAAGLSRREHDILAFERQWWKYAGSKEDAIKELFGMSATRYYQVLNALGTGRKPWPRTRCWSSGFVECGRAARRRARHVGWALRSRSGRGDIAAQPG
ncbi:Fis family transcriptional regulator [Mycobacteroides abscessus]|nr:Fis family transcriptional regulator [Mycobacteroides abscessus]